MQPPLRGKVALVTGAGSGIGRASAVALAEAGAAVVLVGWSAENTRQAASDIQASGGRAIYAQCDVRDRAQVARAVQAGIEAFGEIDILVNSAGINTPRRGVSDISLEDWDKVLQVNLTGAFNCLREVLPGMKARREGLIVNISSMSGKRASRLGGAAYSASKYGLASLTESINIEEAESGIRATAIFPGEVETAIMRYRAEPPPPERLARMLRAQDIAAAVVFVAALPPRAVVSEMCIVPRER